MTDSAGPEAATRPEVSPPRRMDCGSAAGGGILVALVVVYSLLPLGRSLTWAVTMLAIGPVGLIGLVAVQVHSVVR